MPIFSDKILRHGASGLGCSWVRRVSARSARLLRWRRGSVYTVSVVGSLPARQRRTHSIRTFAFFLAVGGAARAGRLHNDPDGCFEHADSGNGARQFAWPGDGSLLDDVHRMAPIGALIAGSLAQRLGAPRTVMIGGAICIIGSAIFALRLPAAP